MRIKLIPIFAILVATLVTKNTHGQGTIQLTIVNPAFTSTGSTTGTLTFDLYARQGAAYSTGAGTGGFLAGNAKYDVVITTSGAGTITLSPTTGSTSNVSAILNSTSFNATIGSTGSFTGAPTGSNARFVLSFTRNNTTDPDFPAITASSTKLFTASIPYTIASGQTVTSANFALRTLTTGAGSSWSGQPTGGGTSGNAFAQGTATALPLDLTEFDATNNGDNRALLQWTTVKEQNTASFEVQRSGDGDNFTETVARVRAAGKSSSLLKYQSYDQQPLSGANYYRLKMIDQDGKYTYSAVRKVTFGDKAPEVVVYPTDNRDGILHVNLTQETAEAQLHLFNAAGQTVAAPVEGLGLNRTMQLSALPAGVYTLQVTDGKTIQAFRVSYQH